MAKRSPKISFVKEDWLRDVQLSACSPTTRGCWMDWLCALDDTGGSMEGTLEQLSRIGRCTVEEARASIDELQSTGTADVFRDGNNVTLVCRRIYRETALRQSSALRMAEKREIARHNYDNGHFTAPTVEEMLAHAKEIDLPEFEAKKCHAYYSSKGWKVGREPMKSWRGAMAGWKLRWHEREGKYAHAPGAPESPGGLPPKRKTLWELKTQLEVIEGQLRNQSTQFGTPNPDGGFTWRPGTPQEQIARRKHLINKRNAIKLEMEAM